MRISLNTLWLKLRNKIRVDKSNSLEIPATSNIVGCTFIIRGTNNKIHIGKHTTIRDCILEINGKECEIYIGDECVIGHNCYFVAKENHTKIKIGDQCMLSRNIKIMASDGHNIFNKEDHRINPSKDIIISNNIWLADNVTVLKGTTIGAYSIIAINATLTVSIPKNSIAAGNPAKIIKSNVYWEK